MNLHPQIIKPPKIRPGDTVGVVSPSWGGAGAYPLRVERGVQNLQELGFRVRLAPHALNQAGFVSDTPANRVQDIHDLFADPDVRVIVAAIGGDHACHLLPLLDFDLIRNNPKVFMGFSDVTVLNVAIWQATGLVTFNGPALLTDFAEYPRMLSYTERYFLKAVTAAEPVGPIEPAKEWTEAYQDWALEAEEVRPRPLTPSPGWTWLKAGRAEGRLIGGCLESLQHLRGTRFWPDWEEAIFFFETSEERPPPETVDGMLMDYENMGILGKIRGMLVGRPMRYSDAEKRALDEIILERTQGFQFPIVTGVDFGHTSPQLTLPLGCLAGIDTARQRFEILEPAVL
jgi:muramoyltetrapeptide carboxypeptidase LdcA involved in peptidoglycan recycling